MADILFEVMDAILLGLVIILYRAYSPDTFIFAIYFYG